MGQKDDKSPLLPEGFEHTEERLNEAQEQILQHDEQIKNVPKDQGPRIEYKPPGYIGTRQPGSRDRTIAFLTDRRDQIKADTLAKTEADTRSADNKTGRIVRDKVREELFPNPYRGLSREELAEHKTVSKEIEQSQDYMDAKLVAAEAERDNEPPQETPPPTTPPTFTPNQKGNTSISTRFSMSLGYTKLSDDPNPAPNQSRDKTPDKDRD